MSARVVPVSALLTRLKNVIAQSVPLDGVWIQGEISNLTKHRSGHYYFSIKDSRSEMSCVMFASYVNRLRFSVEEGMQVLVNGSVSIYEQRGSLQLYVKAMRPEGIGELYLEFEQRKRRLEQQGYFSEEAKKPQPAWIENIGIVTARDGAALQDVLVTLKKRWPMMNVTLYPALVQGRDAPASLMQALRGADRGGHDALLLVRGGGSFEDLFCFNDENLVKTIYNLDTFLVAGIGHEVDTTLAELAADVRVATPTYAAQRVSRDQYDALRWIEGAKQFLTDRTRQMIAHSRTVLSSYENNPYLRDPLMWVVEKQMRLDQLSGALENALTKRYEMACIRERSLKDALWAASPRHAIESGRQKLDSARGLLNQNTRTQLRHQKERFARSVALLDACSPLQVLSRGYAIVQAEGKVVRAVDEVRLGEEVRITVSDGTLKAAITKKEKTNG